MKQITIITLLLFTYNNFSSCCIPFIGWCTPNPTLTEYKEWDKQQLDSIRQLPKQIHGNYSFSYPHDHFQRIALKAEITKKSTSKRKKPNKLLGL